VTLAIVDSAGSVDELGYVEYDQTFVGPGLSGAA